MIGGGEGSFVSAGNGDGDFVRWHIELFLQYFARAWTRYHHGASGIQCASFASLQTLPGRRVEARFQCQWMVTQGNDPEPLRFRHRYVVQHAERESIDDDNGAVWQARQNTLCMQQRIGSRERKFRRQCDVFYMSSLRSELGDETPVITITTGQGIEVAWDGEI